MLQEISEKGRRGNETGKKYQGFCVYPAASSFIAYQMGPFAKLWYGSLYNSIE